MKRSIIIMAAIILLALPLAGCVTDDSPDKTITPLLTEISNLKNLVTKNTTDVAKLKEDVAKKADSSRVDSLATSISKPANVDTYTKAEVDAAIASAINTLKSNQSWITGSDSSSSGGSDTGTVIFTNNPVSIPQIFSSEAGASSTPWIMTIKNNSSTWQYVKPVVQLNVASGQPGSRVSDISLLISGGACTMTGSFTDDGGEASIVGDMSFSPATMNGKVTPSIVIIPISDCNGSGEIQIAPGQSQAVNVQIQNLKTPDPILWNVTTSISSRSM